MWRFRRVTSSQNIKDLQVLPDDQEDARTTNVVYLKVLEEVSDFQTNVFSYSNFALQLLQGV